MNNEEMFMTIMNRLDSMETGLNGRMDKLDASVDKLDGRVDKLDGRVDKLEGRMDKLEGRMDKLDGRIDRLEDRMDTMEDNINLEFYAVRVEMDTMNKSLQQEIRVLNDKVDRLMFTKDVEGYDKINARFEVLEQGYRELKEKIV